MDKRVVLMYPYFYENDPVEKLFQPLGISYLASQLKELGVKTDIVDCTFSSFDEAVETVVTMKPAIIGISIMISFSRSAFDLARALRDRLPNTLFVCGGPLPTLYPHHFLNAFDIVFRGEGDLIFPNFCQNYLNKRRDFIEALEPEVYPGIYFMRNGSLCNSNPIHHSEDVLRSLPPPYRDGKNNKLYQDFWRKNETIKPAMIMVTRGCPFTCDFCSKPVWGNLFRKPSLEMVFREIEEIITLGFDQLWIADDSFTLDTDFLISFCKEKINRNLNISWTCLSRTKGITEDIVDIMKKAGCVKAYFGLETGSNEVLALMSKDASVEDGIAAVKIFDAAEIKTGGFFIVGYPGETEETIRKTFDLALALPLDEIFFNIPLPLPGSGLFERVIGIDEDIDWSKASETRFVYKSEFDEAWLKSEIKKTMYEFNKRNKKK
jgi:anaerobic magnesium-protoporphyrin IX monomethyl ester cyclase